MLVRLALLEPGPLAPLQGPVSLAAFASLAETPYPEVALRTVRLALLTTLATIGLGFPVAVVLARSRGVWRSIQILVVVSPLLMSVVVRAYGWMLLLGSAGFLGAILEAIGLPRAGLLNTETAVLIALTESFLPFSALAIAASLDRIDPRLLDAARSLGATPASAFFRVVLPLALPGVLAGASFVMIGGLSAFATPALLGGAATRTLVLEIYELVVVIFDWPTAAAASLALLLTLVAGGGGPRRC